MSYYKEAATARRDFRHTHDGPEVARGARSRTRRRIECRHSPDELHSYIEQDGAARSVLRDFRCEFCNKRDIGFRIEFL